MDSLDRRERLLLLVLVGLLLIGGVYYSGTLVSGAQSVLELTGWSEGTAPAKQDRQTLEDPASFQESVLRRYRKHLMEFVGVESPEVFWGANGWSGSFDVAMEMGSDTEPRTTVQSGFRGTVFADGLLEGKLQSESDTWRVWSYKGDLHFDRDSVPKFRLGDVQFRDPPPFSMDLDGLGETDITDVSSEVWLGQSVYVLHVDVSSGSGRLYVTRDEPHRLLELILESDSTWSRQFDYRKGNSDQLAAMRTYRNQNLVDSFHRSDGETRTLVYRSRGSSSPAEVIKLSYTPDDRTSDVHFEASSSLGEDPFLSGSGRLTTSSDRLHNLEFKSEWTVTSGSTVPIRLSFRADELTMEEDPKRRAVNDSQSYEDVSARELIQKITSDSPVNQEPNSSGTVSEQSPPEDTKPADARSGSEPSPTPSPEPDPSDTVSMEKKTADLSTSDQTQTEDWPEPPEGSGETVVKNPGDGYPRTIPPSGFQRARRYYESGDLDRANDDLDDLAETYPKSANVQFLLGVIEYERGQRKRAERHFRAVTQLPHDPQLRAWSRTYLRLLGLGDGGS